MPRNNKRKKNNATKAVAYVLAMLIAIGGGGTGGFFLYGANHNASDIDKPVWTASADDNIAEISQAQEESSQFDLEDLPTDVIEQADSQTNPENMLEESSQSNSQIFFNGAPTVSQAVINDSLKKLYINASSIEKDLKIKIEDETRSLVGGQKFVVYLDKTTDKASTTVARGNSDAPANGVKTPGAALAAQKASAAGTNGTKSWVAQPGSDVSSIYTSATSIDTAQAVSYSGTAYTDDDGDGVIYIKNLDGGNYRLTLEAMSGYYTADATGVFNVKDKIEYKAVDVKDQIKKENQVDVSKEEGGKTGAATEEVAVTDASQLEVEETNADVSTLSRAELALPKAKAGDGESSAVLEADFAVIQVSMVNVSRRSGTVVATGDVQDLPNDEGSNTDKKEGEPSGENTSETKEPDADATSPKHNADTSKWEYDKNYHWNSCSVTDCHEENKASHTFGEWEITLPPTTTLTGLRERKCTICEYKESEEIEKLVSTEVDSSKQGKVSIPASATLYASTINGVGTLSIPLSQSGDLVTEVRWESSDTSIVNVSGDKSAAELSAGVAGSARITAIVTYIKSKNADGTNTTDTVSLYCDVEVRPLSDDTLKDGNGTTVYIDKSLKTEAKQSDIEKYDTFYAGKLSAVYGIDVSKYNGTVNWSQVANQGMHFAIIRAGYRGYGSGVLVEDSQFRNNMAGASKAGMKIGVYFFSQAVTEAEAVEEASMVISMVSGYGVSYPIFIDSEYANGSHSGRADGLSKDARTAITKAFCNTIQNSGYKAGVYASKTWFSEHLNVSALSGYYIWVAQYNTSCTYGGKYNLWQYTMKGSCAGVSGKVDVNVSYMGY